MTLVWLQPLGLLALAALLVPLLAHLRRATEAGRLDFAALRWLQPRRRPRRRLRLREWLLLGLRLLLVAAVALLLAEPARLAGGAAPPQVFVAPGLSAAQARAAWPTLPEETRWHWLAPGLPALDVPGPRATPGARAPRAGVPTASLLREADARAPAGATLYVLVPPRIDGADAERPRLAHRVVWRVAAADPFAAEDAAPPTAPALAPLVLRGDADRDPEAARVLRAVATAWRAPGAAPPADAAAWPPRTARLAWLGVRAPPPALRAWVAAGGVALLVPPRDAAAAAARTPATRTPAANPSAATAPTRAVGWRRDDGTVLADAEAIGRGRLLRLRVPLAAATLPEAYDPAFPAQLAQLFDGGPSLPTRVPAEAVRPLPGGARYPTPPRPLAPAFALAAALLFFAERLLATRARREAGA